MNEEAAIYDLGEVGLDEKPPRRSPAQARNRSSQRRRVTPAETALAAGHGRIREALSVSFALFVPGAGQILKGDLRLGMFYLSAMGLFGALGWAILETLDRLGATFRLFGLPAGIGPWALGAIFTLATVTYVANVCGAVQSRITVDQRSSPSPLITGIASALIPGWGQALAGHRLSAAMFLSGCCLVGASWILVSPFVQSVLDSQGLYLPGALKLLGSPLSRWTLPAILWPLAVYDAVFRARLRR